MYFCQLWREASSYVMPLRPRRSASQRRKWFLYVVVFETVESLFKETSYVFKLNRSLFFLDPASPTMSTASRFNSRYETSTAPDLVFLVMCSQSSSHAPGHTSDSAGLKRRPKTSPVASFFFFLKQIKCPPQAPAAGTSRGRGRVGVSQEHRPVISTAEEDQKRAILPVAASTAGPCRSH